jgi:hypothetical protein
MALLALQHYAQACEIGDASGCDGRDELAHLTP